MLRDRPAINTAGARPSQQPSASWQTNTDTFSCSGRNASSSAFTWHGRSCINRSPERSAGNPSVRKVWVSIKFREEKRTQTQTFWSGYFPVGWGSSRERVGAKKFDTSLETREIKLFGRDIPGFCRDIPGEPEKFEKKKVCVQFPFPKNSCPKNLVYPPPPKKPKMRKNCTNQ